MTATNNVVDYSIVLSVCFPNDQWALSNNDYLTLQWFSDNPKPTQAQLDELWPQANYQSQCAIVEATRRVAYENQSDGLFFEWQRGDGTEAAWREAVAAVKAANPYPPAP